MKVWKKYFYIIMICNERQVKEAEGEKMEFSPQKKTVIEELARNGSQICSIQ